MSGLRGIVSLVLLSFSAFLQVLSFHPPTCDFGIQFFSLLLAKTRRSYLTDDLIDYALGEGSDEDGLAPSVVGSLVDHAGMKVDSSLVEENINDASVASSSTMQNNDSIETSSCSTIAGIEDGNSNSTQQTSSPYNQVGSSNAVTNKDVSSFSNSAPQLLIPAQIESDTCVVEKILTSRVVSPNQKTNEKPAVVSLFF